VHLECQAVPFVTSFLVHFILDRVFHLVQFLAGVRASFRHGIFELYVVDLWQFVIEWPLAFSWIKALDVHIEVRLSIRKAEAQQGVLQGL